MRVKTLFLAAVLLLIAAPVFAQETASGAGGFVLPTAFAMAIASSFCIARNPGAAGAIRILLLLGLAFIESLALFTLIRTV
jgi:F-type H+-transporting ATPase subunit c